MKLVILGAGLMARGAAFDFLKNDQVTALTVADSSDDALRAFRARFPDPRVATTRFDAQDSAAVRRLLQDADGVFCAVHYGFNIEFARAAIATKTHMVDLGGNNDIVAAELAMTREAEAAGITIIPDCGLAPGMVSIFTAWGLNKFPWADTVKIRVGGLPAEPKYPFEYERLFSVEGLINEYVEPPVALRDGRIVVGEPLGDVEDVIFDRPLGQLEAFNTSGGTSTLPTTYAKRVKNLDYKTLRYPGHAKAMQWLLHLGLFSSEPVVIDGHPVIPRRLTANRILAKVPLGMNDLTVVRVQFEGVENGQRRLHQVDIIDRYDATNNLTSMMRTTAFPAAIILQMACDGRIAKRGVLPQEIAVDPDVFIPELMKRGIPVKGV
ncbi:MAG TPA: saccharopine dehydrogenase C-terminal domain-containing protein [bacterium]|nr:saccharopine dehydrogenase C-terminal domain-containing protein [bacterium]